MEKIDRYVNATSIVHDGNNSFQINYKGLTSEVLKNFEEYCVKNSIKWARMFNERTGSLISFYQGGR